MSENEFFDIALPYLDAILMMMIFLTLAGFLLLFVSVILWLYSGLFIKAFSESDQNISD